MKLFGPSSAYAPMPTGHPLGLPGQMSVRDTTTRVAEPPKSNSTNLATHLGLPARKADPAKRDAQEPALQPVTRGTPAAGSDGDQGSIAPPTILQIKINEMLQAQAEARRAEAARMQADHRETPDTARQSGTARNATDTGADTDVITGQETDAGAPGRTDAPAEAMARPTTGQSGTDGARPPAEAAPDAGPALENAETPAAATPPDPPTLAKGPASSEKDGGA